MREADDLMEKARRFLRDAELVMKDGGYDTAASRSYYAMFTAARAMLLTEDLEPHTHKGVIQLMTERLIRAGRFDSAHVRSLIMLYDLRQRGDYGMEVSVTKEEAVTALERARVFLAAAEKWLAKAERK